MTKQERQLDSNSCESTMSVAGYIFVMAYTMVSLYCVGINLLNTFEHCGIETTGKALSYCKIQNKTYFAIEYELNGTRNTTVIQYVYNGVLFARSNRSNVFKMGSKEGICYEYEHVFNVSLVLCNYNGVYVIYDTVYYNSIMIFYVCILIGVVFCMSIIGSEMNYIDELKNVQKRIQVKVIQNDKKND
jgi:hypothetical protein